MLRYAQSPSTSWTATAKVPWGGGGEKPLLPWAPVSEKSHVGPVSRDPLGADDHPAEAHSEDSLEEEGGSSISEGWHSLLV